MSGLYCQSSGQGDYDLVMLHGWGLNSEVWRCIADRLGSHFCLHLVDLPGFGRSQGFAPCNLAQMTDAVEGVVPDGALLLGWSLGGLVASELALRQPERYAGLITVASSPHFIADDAWPGIKPETLTGFQQQLNNDFQRTVERFLALQTLGTGSARQDARILQQVVLTQPMPSVAVLEEGLTILQTTDLRQPLASLRLPFLRIYGYLDGLVPRAIVHLLDRLWPQSYSLVMDRAAHAPFISHPQEFCQHIINFAHQLRAI